MDEFRRTSVSSSRDRNKFWLESYPPGTPSEIDPAGIPTLKAMCERACTRYGDSTAFAQGDRTLTFKELEAMSHSFGTWLLHSGMKKGDRVALMLPNVIEYPIALFGALRAGMVIVNLNPMCTTTEIDQVLRDSGAVIVVTLGLLRKTLDASAAAGDLRFVVSIGNGTHAIHPAEGTAERSCHEVAWRDALRSSASVDLSKADVEPHDLAFIQYTGGTTGLPKGVMLTHGNVCANISQSVAWINGYVGTQRTLMTVLPLYHIFALEGSLLLFTHVGWRNVLITDARDLPHVVLQLVRYPTAFLSGVNTLFRALLQAPGFDAIDFSGLEITLSGGMATDTAVAQRWYETTGCHITQAWGLTETSPGATINPPGHPFNGSVGLPIPSTELAIRNAETGAELPIGEIGEICVRGPQVTSGYWRRPEESARAFWPGGWLRSGDIGRLDERGFVYLVERLKDIIVVSGFNVYPQEVEAVAATYPGVIEVAATAQQDAESGESVALFVVWASAAIDEDGLIRHCRRSLAPYKVPRRIYAMTQLPRSVVGKVLRKVLREGLSNPRQE